jgi:pSer/pThr/pTyr-binding forkhead associated (FHA) protein
MDLKLKVIVGGNAGQEVRILGPKFFIGRAEDCHLRPRSDLISRHHCVLILEERLAAVRDFGSKNGTYVNGERVGTERELRDGDVLKVGPLEFQVSLTEVVAAKKRPAVTSIKEAATRTASTEFDLDKDLNGWLTDSGQNLRESDTRELNFRDTDEVVLNPPAGEEAAETPTPEDEAKKPGEKKAPGKLPNNPSVVSGSDSFSAAAEMLRRLRKR